MHFKPITRPFIALYPIARKQTNKEMNKKTFETKMQHSKTMR